MNGRRKVLDAAGGFAGLMEALEGSGALLVVEKPGGGANAMTIGWAQLGRIWGKTVLSVLVRPSRYTHELMEKAPGFSVCLPSPGGWKKELALCGSKSGRGFDKLAACGLKAAPGAGPGIYIIDGAQLCFECAVISKSEIIPQATAPAQASAYYASGDWHTVYFGEVLRVSASEAE